MDPHDAKVLYATMWTGELNHGVAGDVTRRGRLQEFRRRQSLTAEWRTAAGLSAASHGGLSRRFETMASG